MNPRTSSFITGVLIGAIIHGSVLAGDIFGAVFIGIMGLFMLILTLL